MKKRILDICAETLSPGDPAEAEAKVIPQDSRGRELVDSKFMPYLIIGRRDIASLCAIGVPRNRIMNFRVWVRAEGTRRRYFI